MMTMNEDIKEDDKLLALAVVPSSKCSSRICTSAGYFNLIFTTFKISMTMTFTTMTLTTLKI